MYGLLLIMAGAIVQTVYNKDDSGATSLTIAVTINGVVAGNHLVAFVGHGTTATTISGVNDGVAYVNAGAQVDDVGNGQSSQIWYKENSGSGNFTVTATFSSAVTSRRIRVAELSGLQPSGSLDQTTGQAQTNPGTGANAVSSGASAATVNANDFVLGFTQDTAEVDPGSGTLSAGTGYAISGVNLILGVESKSVVATGAQTATFTTSVVTNDYTTHVVAFKEIAAGGAAQRLALLGAGS